MALRCQTGMPPYQCQNGMTPENLRKRTELNRRADGEVTRKAARHLPRPIPASRHAMRCSPSTQGATPGCDPAGVVTGPLGTTPERLVRAESTHAHDHQRSQSPADCRDPLPPPPLPPSLIYAVESPRSQ